MRETEWRGIAAGLWRDGETEAESARAALRETLDEIDRLRALPVLRTCRQCADLEPTSGGWACGGVAEPMLPHVPGIDEAPPTWCPLRGVR